MLEEHKYIFGLKMFQLPFYSNQMKLIKEVQPYYSWMEVGEREERAKAEVQFRLQNQTLEFKVVQLNQELIPIRPQQ